MSDALTNLLTANRSSTVLQGIANPPQINPLAAMAGAAQTAQAIYGIRAQQAQQAIGGILQQATDANGNVDYEQAGRLAAAAGPTVQMGMQSYLLNASNLRSQQLAQGISRNATANTAIIGALNGDDAGLHDRVIAGFNGLVSNGVMTQDQATRSALNLPSDPGQLRQRLLQIQTSLMPGDANTIMDVPYPQFNPDGTRNPNWGRTYPMRKGDVVPMLAGQGGGGGATGGAVGGLPPSLRNPANQPPTASTTTAPAATTPAPAGAPTGTPPVGPPVSAGQAIAGGSAAATPALPLPPTPPAGGPPPVAATTTAPSSPSPLPAPAGAVWNPNNAVGTSTLGPGTNAAAAALGTAKATGRPVPVPGGSGLVAKPDGTVGPPVAPAPPPGTSQKAAMPLSYNATTGGVPVASINALAPNLGAPSPPSPAVAGDVNAMLAGMQRGTTPATGTVAAGPAATTYFGTGPSAADIEQQKRGVEQGMTGFQAISDQAVASRPRSAILGNMLADTSQFTTGPLTERIATMRNWANRIGVPVNTEGLSAQESFNKLAAQLVNAQGAGVGTDAKLNMNVAANPHQELSPQGVDLMLRQLQGNEDYLQARARLAASYGDQTDIKKFESDVGNKVDPRAFQFARMTPEQRQTYDKALSPTDRAAVRSSYNWLANQGILGN